MMNQIILIGRLVKDVEVQELENGRSVSTITLAVQRSYKNEEGIYDTDFVEVLLWNVIATNTAEYCRKGDLIGIKGRIEIKNIENEDGTKSYKMEVVAEKVTFLSSRKYRYEIGE